MKRKKILFVNAGLHISGVTRVLINLANALVEKGYDITIKTVTADDDLAGLLDKRIKYELLLKEPKLMGKRIRGWLKIYYKLIEIIFQLPAKKQYEYFVKDKYDVEIAFNRGIPARLVSASTNTGSTKLVWVHNDYMLCDNPLAGFKNIEDARNAYKKFDKVVCVSKQAEVAFIKKYGFSDNVVTRYNVNNEYYMLNSPLPKDVEKKCFTLIAVGRLSKQKAYELLLGACKLLNDDGIAYELWIIGDGEEKENLIALKKKLNLENVKFLGSKQNPYSYFKLADLYVSSSIYEGLSTTTIESLIMGVPAVVTDCTGMRDILGDSEYGLITPINVYDLYHGIRKIIIDNNLMEKYEKKIKIRAKDFYKGKTLIEIENLF